MPSSDPGPTIAQLLAAAAATLSDAGLPSGRRDAEVLLEHATGWSAAHRIAAGNEPAGFDLRERFATLLARRGRGEPVAYVTGQKEFYSLPLAVDSRVLVPRPETEHVVELALREIVGLAGRKVDAAAPLAVPRVARAEGRSPGRDVADGMKESSRIADIGVVRVVDVGTGSGAIALALASVTKAWPRGALEIVALDRSEGALTLARENARRLDLAEWIRFLRADLLEALAFASVDVVVANPPYLSEDDLAAAPPDLDFEPRDALYGGDRDGLGVFRELVAQTRRALRPGGVLVSEIGAAQGPIAMAIAKNHGFRRVAVSQDLAGLDRIVVAHASA